LQRAVIITTINARGATVDAFEHMPGDWHVVVVGDERSKPIQSSDRITFLSLEDQLRLPFATARRCPRNHYARKNIGYLYALAHGASVLYETDDDNVPCADWAFPPFMCRHVVECKAPFFNVYAHFSTNNVWPRGFPLDEALARPGYDVVVRKVSIGVWQGLVEGEPDVDAIYRLVVNEKVRFERKRSVALTSGCFCPFNSQNTLWARETVPCAYLPSTVSFRFTDILRGYIAQAIMWGAGLRLGFTGPSVLQQRNAHDLLNDFRQEVECYLQVKKVADHLRRMDLSGDMGADMTLVYGELTKMGVVQQEEMEMLRFWLSDIKEVMS